MITVSKIGIQNTEHDDARPLSRWVLLYSGQITHVSRWESLKLALSIKNPMYKGRTWIQDNEYPAVRALMKGIH